QGVFEVVGFNGQYSFYASQCRGLCGHRSNTFAQHCDINYTTESLCAAQAFGSAQVQRIAIVFCNNQSPAHTSPRFFSSCTSCAALSIMTPFCRCDFWLNFSML